MDTQLLLAEVYGEAGRGKESAQLLQPLIDAAKASKPETLDPTLLRTFVAAVRAYLIDSDLAKAGDVLTVLTDLGADTPQVNSMLGTFAKMLATEFQNAKAAEIEAESGDDPAAKEKAATNVERSKKILSELLVKLAKREEQPAGQSDLHRQFELENRRDRNG